MNRLIIPALLLAASVLLAEEQVIRLSEPVHATADYEEFGARLPEDPRPVPLAALIAGAESALGKASIIEARVGKVCQKKGCFFIAQDGDAVVRVSFKDYAFFVPTDIGSRRVLVSGVLIEREVSAEESAHYAADLEDETTPVKAGVAYEIVADAVRVPTG